MNPQFDEINKINVIIKSKEKDIYSFPPDDNNPPPSDGPFGPDDSEDIFLKVDKLIAKEKELNLIYDSEYNKFLNYETQIQNQILRYLIKKIKKLNPIYQECFLHLLLLLIQIIKAPWINSQIN